MFKKKDKISSSEAELSNYIYGFDIYDSTLLSYLSGSNFSRTIYKVNKYEFRPDLIAKDFYGSTDYTALLLIQTGLGVEDFTKGTILKLLPKSTIDILIDSLY